MCELLDDPQIQPSITRGLQGLLTQLHHAVGVADGAGLFRPGAGRQHHVGHPCGLGQEDVLHHQVLEARQGMAGVVQVGVAHGRVLTQDVHAANLVRIGVGGEGAIHDFHHGVTGLIVQGHAPEVLEPAVCLGVVHPLVVGKHHGDQARVAGALHIVLSTQGVQPGAQASDLAGDAGQRDQAAHVVGAVHMLAHTHAPEDHGGLGLGVGPCHFAKGGGGYAADLGHPFR